MSDSLRDQLLQAGFSAPREKPKKPGAHAGSGKPAKGSKASGKQKQADAARQKAQEQAREIERRKAIKAKIKALVEEVGIKDIQGESVYRFMLNKRIRELHVKEDIRSQLVDGTLVITRLNGSTWVIPADQADPIRTLNPDWVIVVPGKDSQDESDDYSDFPVPDDLQW